VSRVGRSLAAAASRFVDTPFQLGGRNPATGLDCVGLVVASLEAIGRKVGPTPHYGLRQTRLEALSLLAASSGLKAGPSKGQIGDVILLRPSPAQWHLAILGHNSQIIHAHAGLRRVVAGPLPQDWPIERRWHLDEVGDL